MPPFVCRLSLFINCAALLVFAPAAPAADKPWNIVIITADDLNADSMGWMGSKVGATPHIDAFAARSFQFRNCHANAPVCQAARSALMTGCEPRKCWLRAAISRPTLTKPRT
jgi:hypothetical protein